MMANPQKKYAISSLNKDLKYNKDGSLDVFYGPDFDRLGKTWTAKRPEKIN